MNVSVSQPNLAQALSVVTRAVSSRSSLPILENILLETQQDQLCLSATNLELGLKYWIPAQVEEEGSVTIPAKIFTDLVNQMAADTVSLKLTESTQTITVKCLKLVTDIRGIEASEFPPLPEFNENEAISFEMQELKKMIGQVAFAAATDDNRPVLHGIKMEADGNNLSMAATDGFRVAVKKILLKNEISTPMSAIIPANAMKELARMAGANDKTVLMSFCNGHSQVIFHLENGELACQLIAGEFINYQAIIPQSFKTTTTVSTAVLLKACGAAGVIARENKNLIKLDIQTAEDTSARILITAVSEQNGNQENMVPANVEGDDIIIAFNVRYIQDVLNVIESPNVHLLTNASMSPAMIIPADEEDDYKYVIMPMHIP